MKSLFWWSHGFYGGSWEMGSVKFGFGLLCQLPEVMVANMTYMSHGKLWLAILTFQDGPSNQSHTGLHANLHTPSVWPGQIPGRTTTCSLAGSGCSMA